MDTNNSTNNTNNQNNVTNNNIQANSANPHYENIYESLDQYAAAAVAPANNNPIQQSLNINRNAQNNNPLMLNRNMAYRNELYDRTAGYDVPRQMYRAAAGLSNGTAAAGGTKRRANLHLDLNPNRPRYTTASRPHRQRSFDDTESNYNNFRYENIYEQIHEEPIYRNCSNGSTNGGVASNRVYGRLGVIGHGIGRIERHLSSSCGNIDHYNLGGHYAVLGHSHLGTVGHIRLNAGNAPSGANTKDTNSMKSLNFFSCLGRENSQSMTNIHRAAATTNNNNNNVPQPAQQQAAATGTASKTGTGAIPKTPKLKAQKSNESTTTTSTTNSDNASASHTSSLNRMSKSSLQWLLVNKWLPMWIGQEPDCNILDFNFMFSRDCGGCGGTLNRQQSVVRFNGHAEMNSGGHNEPKRTFAATSNGGSMRPMRLNHSLTRLRECEYGLLSRQGGSLDERSRVRDGGHDSRERYREDYYENKLRRRRECNSRDNDPFRNWELNTENNSFRPAGGVTRVIRRITDGTYPSTSSGVGAGNMTREPSNSSDVVAATARPSTSNNSTNNMERLTSPRVLLDSRTESGNESPSPDLGGRRYSDNTEDDQHNEDDNNAAANENDNDSDIN